MAKAVRPSVSVTGQRSANISETAFPANVEPKSPVKIPWMYFRYWTMKGSLRLNSCRRKAS